MNNTPKVSVLLSTYNDEKYIKECVESVLNQSFSDFEFIIIDDGSTDGTYDVISKIHDSRIKVFRKENTGIIDSVNFGISKCIGEYIARMDGDDVCHVDRLKCQLDFLTNNLDYSICGSNTIYIDGAGRRIGKTKFPISNEAIKEYMLFGSPISNPSVMVRREVLVDNAYSKEFPVAEDYELWIRLRDKYKFFNIKKPLLFYRFHGHNISIERRTVMAGLVRNVYQRYFNDIVDEDMNPILFSFLECSADRKREEYIGLIDKLLRNRDLNSVNFRKYATIWWFIISLKKKSIRMLICNPLFSKYPLEYIKTIFGYIDMFRLRIFLKKRLFAKKLS